MLPKDASKLLLATAVAALFALAPAFGEEKPGAKLGESAGGPNITQQVQSEATVNLPSLSPIVQRVMPAVVNVSVTMSRQQAAQAEGGATDDDDDSTGPQGPQGGGTPFDEMLRRFFGQRGGPGGQPPGAMPGPGPGGPGAPQGPRGPGGPGGPGGEVMALGSGFIIDPSGYVVTNNHVTAGAENVTVVFQDNSKHPAKVVGRDAKTDLALLKIDGDKKLPYVTWGDSEVAKVGDWVVAVGNPFGLGGSVTAGIISALGRDINAGPYDDFLQIDAPINRGNSGGPTFNLSGQVIGINTAIYSPSGGSVGIGFAIPSSLAKNIVAQLKDQGHVTRGWLGVQIQNITPPIAKSLGLDPEKPEGALVAAVQDNSPAAKAGLKQGDIIKTANGRPIHTVHDLPRLVAESPIGQKIAVEIVRGGKPQKIDATVAELKEDEQKLAAKAPDPADDDQKTASALGLQLAELDAQLRKRLRVPKDTNGVLVKGLAVDSPAAAVGVQPGDVVVSIDQQPVSEPADAAQKLKDAAGKGHVLLLLNRQGVSQFVGVAVEPETRSGSSIKK